MKLSLLLTPGEPLITAATTQLKGMASPVDDVSTENGADWSGDVATENGSKQLIGDDVTGREEPLWSLIGS